MARRRHLDRQLQTLADRQIWPDNGREARSNREKNMERVWKGNMCLGTDRLMNIAEGQRK